MISFVKISWDSVGAPSYAAVFRSRFPIITRIVPIIPAMPKP